MVQDFNFRDLAEYSLQYITDLVPELLPGGKVRGNEWICGSRTGGPGDSMSVNLTTGKWADFATDDAGLDLLSLSACVRGEKMFDAAKWLTGRVNYRTPDAPVFVPDKPRANLPPPDVLTLPPPDMIPDLKHFKHGDPSTWWTYRTSEGVAWFFVARYDIKGEGKQFAPWSYSDTRKKLIMRGPEGQRPLYNLHKIAQNKDQAVLIVEGEKAATGAEKIGAEANYVITTWAFGAKSWAKSDWSAIAGRNVLIWPDADDPGRECAAGLAAHLSEICPQIKIIQPDREDGWDAWDAYVEGMDWPAVIAWAKPNVIVYQKQSPIKAPQPEPEPMAAEIVEPTNESEPDRKEVDLNIKTDGVNVSDDLKAIYLEIGVACSRHGKPFQNISNIARIFEGIESFKGHFWYDEFDYRCYTDLDGKSREVSDADIIKITVMIQRKFGLITISTSLVFDAIVLYSKQNTRHAVRHWVESIKWDGASRVSSFFIEKMGVEDNEYTRAVSHNFWVGMMARIFRPGCKNDYMVVLEGAQGIGKSMALSCIGGKWHTESSESVGSKDFFQNLHGKMIVEIAELDSFTRAEVTKVKQIVTATADRFRPSYGRTSSDFHRQCIFVGTTNESGYLRDATGARRFWPLACGQINIDEINSDREQLFAEAYQLFKNGDPWHIVPAALAAEEQEKRYSHDEIEIAVREYINGKTHIIMLDMAKDALHYDEAKFDVRHQKRIGVVLHRLGWFPRRATVNGYRTRVWQPKGSLSLVDQDLLGDGVGFSDGSG